jgi:lipopolysaccharide/colanic/teichoic acid biosynthesis glycosyltransferase
MKKSEQIKIFITPFLEILWIIGIFFWAFYLRQMTDGIPFIQLKIPYISLADFLPFIYTGTGIWVLIFWIHNLYTIRIGTPLVEEIRFVLKYSFVWILAFMSIVYLWTGFIYTKELPRLILGYVFVWSATGSILIRSGISIFFHWLQEKKMIEKAHILILFDTHSEAIMKTYQFPTEFTYIQKNLKDIEGIIELIRERKIQAIVSLVRKQDSYTKIILKTSKIYGIPFVYPKFLLESGGIEMHEGFFWSLETIELRSISISIWERILKRIVDVCIAGVFLILFFPLFCLIALLIKLEDPSGPVIFINRRIWQNGHIFSLFKFRYMYWKYCIKDAYWLNADEDIALKYEESLKKENDTRDGPLYKIKNDPRKTKVGTFIERLSLDELPQLINVLRWDMSLVWPRPHQPREVNLYDEEDTQVLNIKPWITGMAQVYGREKNSFKEEVSLDKKYIEQYSFWLDLAILIRTFFVVITRIWKK